MFLPNAVLLILSGSSLKYLFIFWIFFSMVFTAALSAGLEPFVTAFIFSDLVLCLFNFAASGSSAVLKSAFNLLFNAISADSLFSKYFTPINSFGIFVVLPWGVANTILYFALAGMSGFCFLSKSVICLITLCIFLGFSAVYFLWDVAVNAPGGTFLIIPSLIALVTILPLQIGWLLIVLQCKFYHPLL